MEQFEEGQELTVEPYFEDIPLGEFLRAYTPFDSKRKLQKLVDRGIVEVNGITRPLNFMLQSGDVVKIGQRSEERDRSYPDPSILTVKDNLVVANTFPGQQLGIRPNGTVLKETDATEEFIRESPFEKDSMIYPVYPVPEGGSGIVLLTDREEHKHTRSEQFNSEAIQLSGLAIVDGVLRGEEVIEEPVGPSEHDRSKQEVSEEGEHARTVVSPIQQFRKFTLVNVQPKTTVWDQVRVHLAFIHHPISVDSRYGYRENLKLSEFKEDYREKPFQSERPLIERISLHWNQVQLDDGEEIEVSKPEDVEITIKQLSNHGT